MSFLASYALSIALSVALLPLLPPLVGWPSPITTIYFWAFGSVISFNLSIALLNPACKFVFPSGCPKSRAVNAVWLNLVAILALPEKVTKEILVFSTLDKLSEKLIAPLTALSHLSCVKALGISPLL